MRILGIGNALVDVLTSLESNDYFEEMGLIKGGMKLINNFELSKILGIIEQKDSKLSSGGSASNTIYGLASMGIETGFIGSVNSDDKYGQVYKQDLIKNGVTPMLMNSAKPTGCAMCMITSDGERTMGTFLGAAAEIDHSNFTVDTFKGYDLLHIEGYMVQDHSLIEKAFALAKEAGLKISIDLASFNIVANDLEFFQYLVRNYVDIVFANEEEAIAYANTTPEEAAELLSKECEIAVVKKGSKGSIIRRGDEVVEIGVIKVNCVDTTGAGDLYAAGFLYGYANNLSLEQSAKIGALISGNVVEVVGSRMDAERWKEIKTKVEEIKAQK